MALSGWRCAPLFLFLCSASFVAAADDTGRLEGRVVKEGEGVPAVIVVVPELGQAETTDEKGEFAFDNVPQGNYTMILSLGDNTTTRENVYVTADKTREIEVEVDWELGIYEKVTVTAAARAAKIVDAPAAVTSIPEEQIEQQASTGQVPKLLEFTPGAEVTQSGLYDFNFNTRGFNSSLNRRVSTYIDGRDVGVVLLGAQEWSAIAGGLDDVSNLEFIRGPSAALYGANASSGVINITTKAPRDSVGGMLRVTGGVINTLTPDATTKQAESLREQDFSLDFRNAGKLSESWFYKISAGMRNSGDFTVSRNPDVVDRPEYYLIEPPEEAEQTPFCLLVGETDCLPKEKSLFREQDDEIRYGALRFDKYLHDASLLTFEAGISDMAGPVFQTGIGRVQNIDAQRPFFRFNYSSERWNVLAHYTERQGNQVNLTKALIVNDELITDTQRYGVEGQWNQVFFGDKMRFVIGAAHTEERVDTENPETGKQTVVYEPLATDRQAVFSQVDYRVNKHVSLVFAGRVDANTLHETQFSPKAALVYSINPKNSLRFTYNQAFQVANYSEFFLHTKISSFQLGALITNICTLPDAVLDPPPLDCNAIDVDDQGFIPILAVGNNDLALEKTKAWEVGYSGLFGNKVFLTLDYYNAKNQDFITDLIPQVGTIPGTLEGCLDSDLQPQSDPKQCPVNPDYLPWVGPEDWENTNIIDPSPFDPDPPIRAATALRIGVDRTVGGEILGFRLAKDLDGSTVVVGRTYTNVGQVDTQGVDVGLQYFITPYFNMQASYSWFDYEIIDENADVAAILLPNTPEHKGSVAFSFVKDRWAANLGARWVQGFRWSAGVFQGDVPDYSTVDLSASYGITEMIRIGFNVANLRNTLHRQTFGGDLLARRALINVTYGW